MSMDDLRRAESKYPPAKPGALLREPLKAAGRAADVAPVAVASSRNNSRDRISVFANTDLQQPRVIPRPEHRARSTCRQPSLFIPHEMSIRAPVGPRFVSFSAGRLP